MEVPSVSADSPASPSTSHTSEQPQTEVEVFNFNSRNTLDEVDMEDDAEPELEELDNLSNKSSACDCPAHVHDRDTPLIIDKGMSQAFTLFSTPIKLEEELRPITAPPATNLGQSETGDPATVLTSGEGGSSSSAISITVKFMDLPYKRSYSYGVLEKKWSL